MRTCSNWNVWQYPPDNHNRTVNNREVNNPDTAITKWTTGWWRVFCFAVVIIHFECKIPWELWLAVVRKPLLNQPLPHLLPKTKHQQQQPLATPPPPPRKLHTVIVKGFLKSCFPKKHYRFSSNIKRLTMRLSENCNHNLKTNNKKFNCFFFSF